MTSSTVKRWRSWLVLWLLVVIQATAAFTLIAAFVYARGRGPVGVSFLVLMTALLEVSVGVAILVIRQDRRQ